MSVLKPKNHTIYQTQKKYKTPSLLRNTLFPHSGAMEESVPGFDPHALPFWY
jgi:hypothetical protein